MPHPNVTRLAILKNLTRCANTQLLTEAFDIGKHGALANVGDKVLGLLISAAYYHTMSEDRQSKKVQELACNEHLNIISRKPAIGLLRYLYRGDVQVTGRPRQRNRRNKQALPPASPKDKKKEKKQPDDTLHPWKIEADIFEACVGVAFFEGGLGKAANLLKRWGLDKGNVREWDQKWDEFVRDRPRSLGRCATCGERKGEDGEWQDVDDEEETESGSESSCS